jgi:hypothetical protein
VGETFVAGVRSSLTTPFWFFTAGFLQQPFHNGCYLYWLGLFIESFCCLLLSCAALEKTWLVSYFFEIMNETIACCLSICLYCLFRLGYIVRGVHPFIIV